MGRHEHGVRRSAGRYGLREVGTGDVAALQALIESDAGYVERISGGLPGAAEAEGLLEGRPEGLAEETKVVLGCWDGDALVAVADLLRGYPNQQTAFIGLLQVHGEHQGRGVGAAAYGMVEEYVGASWPEVRTLRLAVVDTNAEVAAGFWLGRGFEPTGEAKPYSNDKVESVVRLYEKRLGWAHPALDVRASRIAGQGLFATEPVSEGSVVGVLTGRKVSTAELRELLEQGLVDAITLDDDEHLVLRSDPRPVIAYGNHSCDPNLWWIDAVTLEARRDIAVGEEVTSDYGTSTGVDFEMACACGSPLCRGKVTGEDWRRPELQERYGDHWIPLLLKRRDQLSGGPTERRTNGAADQRSGGPTERCG